MAHQISINLDGSMSRTSYGGSRQLKHAHASLFTATRPYTNALIYLTKRLLPKQRMAGLIWRFGAPQTEPSMWRRHAAATLQARVWHMESKCILFLMEVHLTHEHVHAPLICTLALSLVHYFYIIFFVGTLTIQYPETIMGYVCVYIVCKPFLLNVTSEFFVWI